MNIFLDDSHCSHALYPFTLTRHTADIRIGILSIREKWEYLLRDNTSINISDNSINALLINANIIPSFHNFLAIIQAYESGSGLMNIADIRILEHPWQIFQYNDWALRNDVDMLTRDKKKSLVSNTNRVTGEENIFIEAGAIVEHSILNATTGPIYIGKNAVVMEGCMIRGPLALGEGAVLKMGTRIYGATTIGPYAVGGGEIKNSVIFGYSNKAHDGYLGDSVIGEWCNLGAGTSNSNVKNTAGEVRYIQNAGEKGLHAGNKGGLLMGDYSRAAINTSFNTGTVVGVCCNIFGQEMPDKYVPSFSWGKGRYDLDKAFKDISNWKKMKNEELTEKEKIILQQLYTSHQ